jgi:hypothetical protein
MKSGASELGHAEEGPPQKACPTNEQRKEPVWKTGHYIDGPPLAGAAVLRPYKGNGEWEGVPAAPKGAAPLTETA